MSAIQELIAAADEVIQEYKLSPSRLQTAVGMLKAEMAEPNGWQVWWRIAAKRVPERSKYDPTVPTWTVTPPGEWEPSPWSEFQHHKKKTYKQERHAKAAVTYHYNVDPDNRWSTTLYEVEIRPVRMENI